MQTLIGQLQALMTSSSISSGRETIVNSAADIGNWIGSSARATLPGYPCAKLQRKLHWNKDTVLND